MYRLWDLLQIYLPDKDDCNKCRSAAAVGVAESFEIALSKKQKNLPKKMMETVSTIIHVYARPVLSFPSNSRFRTKKRSST